MVTLDEIFNVVLVLSVPIVAMCSLFIGVGCFLYYFGVKRIFMFTLFGAYMLFISFIFGVAVLSGIKWINEYWGHILGVAAYSAICVDSIWLTYEIGKSLFGRIKEIEEYESI